MYVQIGYKLHMLLVNPVVAIADINIQLFAQLFNQADPSALTALLDEYDATFEDLDQLLESHVMNSTYDIVFFKITAQLKKNDWDLVEAMRELQVCNQVIHSCECRMTVTGGQAQWDRTE